MAEKQNPAESSSGQSTSKEAIQEIAQTVTQEFLSELKSTSTQQQDLALPSGKRSNFHSVQQTPQLCNIPAGLSAAVLPHSLHASICSY